MVVKTAMCAVALLLAPASGPRRSPAATPPARQAEQPRSAATPQEADSKTGPVDSAQDADSKGTRQSTMVVWSKPGQDAKKLELLPIEMNIVKFTNARRAKYGLPELQPDYELMCSARRHASWMASHRSLVHTSRPVAENIAMGQPHSSSAVRAWMNSSGHRANILNRGHRRIGVAAYRTPGGVIYWCQQFCR